MDREEAKELLPIIKAFADGKTIEVYQKGFGEWRETAKPNFDGDPKNYRVKPEPKYRPFRTQEECWNEMHKHPDFGWVKSKINGNYAIIGKISKDRTEYPFITWATSQSERYAASEIFHNYTFTDDMPFGIKEETSKNQK